MSGRIALSFALGGAWWQIAGATQGQDAPCDGCAAVDSNALLAKAVAPARRGLAVGPAFEELSSNESSVEAAAAATDCQQRGQEIVQGTELEPYRWAPSVDVCQDRCAQAEGCTYYSFWVYPDGGRCTLFTEVFSTEADKRYLSAPACQADAPNTPPAAVTEAPNTPPAAVTEAPNTPPAAVTEAPNTPLAAVTDVDGMLLNAACQPAGATPTRRVRTEIRQTDPSMWTLLRTSWHNIEKSRKYDYFGERHEEAYGGTQDDHGGPTYTSFLAFHRMFGLDLENMLRQEAINTQLANMSTICAMTVPYWDWSDHRLDQVLNSQYLGTTDRSTGCVIDGLPGGFETPMSWVKDRSNRACVARSTRPHWRPRHDVSVFRIGSEAGTDFVKLADDLEKMHNDLHGQMGGNMANKVGHRSPSEPTFFFHHHFVDYLWYRWQTQHESLDIGSLRATLSAVSSNDRVFLAPWVSLYNRQSDCVLVPGSSHAPESINTCLAYEDAANNAMLVQGSDDMDSCATLKAQILNNECTDEELKALPCINTTACLTYTKRSLCVDASKDDCDEFIKLQDKEIADGEECANVVAPPTPHYEFCHDCTFRCSGR